MNEIDSNPELTPEEKALIQSLRDNPIMASGLTDAIKLMKEEIAEGKDAHEAELAVIETVQNLGQRLMTQWAVNTQENALTEFSEKNPRLQKHTKKNSTGIPPSEKSS